MVRPPPTQRAPAPPARVQSHSLAGRALEARRVGTLALLPPPSPATRARAEASGAMRRRKGAADGVQAEGQDRGWWDPPDAIRPPNFITERQMRRVIRVAAAVRRGAVSTLVARVLVWRARARG